MHHLIAIGHIVGAVIALFAYGAGVFLLASYVDDRTKKSELAALSVSLGIPASDLDDPQHKEQVFQFSAERFNSELLRNRLADLCGWINTAWSWVGLLLQIGVLLGALWYTVQDGSENAVHAWWILVLAIIFSVVSVMFGYVCKLLTGRYPGQPQKARKMLADIMEEEKRQRRRSEQVSCERPVT
jgi:hypothetical protein